MVEKVIVRTYPPVAWGHRAEFYCPCFCQAPWGGQRRRFFLLTVIFHRGQRRGVRLLSVSEPVSARIRSTKKGSGGKGSYTRTAELPFSAPPTILLP